MYSIQPGSDACDDDGCVEELLSEHATRDDRLLARLYGRHVKREFLPLKQYVMDVDGRISAIEGTLGEMKDAAVRQNEILEDVFYSRSHGIVYLRQWLCTASRVAVAVVGVVAVLVPVMYHVGKMMGLWG